MGRKPKETYLGDGVYASFDGSTLTLRTPRPTGDHWVALESDVLDALYIYVERVLRGDER